MICSNLKTHKRYNYRFLDPMSLTVEISDFNGNKNIIPYHDWVKEYIIIDKWRNLQVYDTIWGT